MKKAALALALGCVVFLVPPMAFAGDEAPAPKKAGEALAAKVKGLVAQLGDPEFDVRERASAQLKTIGEPALEALREAAKATADAEVKVRAEEAIRCIEEAILDAKKAKIPKVAVGPLVSQTTTHRNGVRLTWGKDADGRVQFRTTDPETGEEIEATAFDWKDFVKRHPDLAKEYEVGEDGPQMRGIRFGAGIQIRGPVVQVEKMVQETSSVKLEALGLEVEALPEVLRYHLALAAGKGAVVKTVAPGGAADRLGIRKHDVLVAFDGVEVKGLANVREIAKTFEKVTVIQKGKKVELAAKKEEAGEGKDEPEGERGGEGEEGK